jgi:hypothetical protein
MRKQIERWNQKADASEPDAHGHIAAQWKLLGACIDEIHVRSLISLCLWLNVISGNYPV